MENTYMTIAFFAVIAFLVYLVLARWVFRIDTIVKKLEEQNELLREAVATAKQKGDIESQWY